MHWLLHATAGHISNLFLSLRLVSLVLSAESYIHIHSQLVHVLTLEIVADQVGVFGLSS